jgi:hypothetical protein
VAPLIDKIRLNSTLSKKFSLEPIFLECPPSYSELNFHSCLPSATEHFFLGVEVVASTIAMLELEDNETLKDIKGLYMKPSRLALEFAPLNWKGSRRSYHKNVATKKG